MTYLSRRSASPWAYKLDYDKAIAEDERQIALYQRVIADGWIKPDSHSGYHYTLLDLFLDAPDRAYAFGLTDLDLFVVAAVYDASGPAELDEERSALGLLRSKGIAAEYTGNVFRAFDVIAAKVNAVFPDGLPTAAEATAWLKKAKTHLSAHKRNRAKLSP